MTYCLIVVATFSLKNHTYFLLEYYAYIMSKLFNTLTYTKPKLKNPARTAY